MSRAIEFRAWDHSRSTMIPAPSSWVATSINDLLNNDEGNWTWLQFTGMTDKNGIKIFEGDIVEIRSESQHLKTKGRVGYHTDVCAFMVWDMVFDGDLFIPITSNDDIEVIGNVYQSENKEGSA